MHAIKVSDALRSVSGRTVSIEILGQLDLNVVRKDDIVRCIFLRRFVEFGGLYTRVGLLILLNHIF